MEFHIILRVFALFFCAILKGSSASLWAEVYWQSMLASTPLPKALQELLQPGSNVSFSYEKDETPQSGARVGYGVGYWPDKREFDKNVVYNETTVYFIYDDLIPNKKMTLIFTKSMENSNFLPRKLAQSIPFSSNKLPNILKHFSIQPTSKKAQIMKQTIEECEAPGIKGEEKKCATSLESLVDIVVLKYGKNVRTLMNEAEEENKKQEYTVLEGIKMMGENPIVCHKERYPFAIYYCHTIMGTKAYMVPLVGDDGSKAKAAVVCHTKTSAWNPQHVAFQVLKVKPGGPPVCHFLNSDTIVWIPN
ncbi:BURP domain-containing protein 5 isoform X2 [Ricinus communis]|uniref:BURP domain-containing protein 5 isoform X2 n=2 Tax=Ricinus communis TaxID=3988 RepID=UPI0007728827|nr:BURP domain-containing protein 5 isoform X2 [Ricinus communis]|eukprot:XP_015577139.1 BURP domain-containing protein 5 isoform X2 [Ricinus communis]